MLTTTIFIASFEFVVWTFSSLYEDAVKSLHVPAKAGFARDSHFKGFPEFDIFYYKAVSLIMIIIIIYNNIATH